MSVHSPPALQRFFAELKRQAPAEDAAKMILSGIAVAKGGYHDSRENNERNHPGDYSIELAIDRQGPSDLAAAIDITFTDAQVGKFGTIAKYASRLDRAYRAEDPRLFYNGERVWREFFGNTDLDRDVEGWSLYRKRFADSDPSHLWHIHKSVHRKFADNFDAQKGALDILLGRPPVPTPTPEPEDDMTPEQAKMLAEVHAKLATLPSDVWENKLTEVGAWSGMTAKKVMVGVSGKGDEDKRRDLELARAERERDASQDRLISQLIEEQATTRRAIGDLVTAVQNLAAEIDTSQATAKEAAERTIAMSTDVADTGKDPA